MTPKEQMQLRQLNEALSGSITIGLTQSEDPRGQELFSFCEELTQLVPKIRLDIDDATRQAPPHIRIGSGLRYFAVPQGTELGPFTDALTMLGGRQSRIKDELQQRLSRLELPATLRLYVAADCAFCPQAVRQFLPWPFASSHITLEVVDSNRFFDLATSDKIQAVPTLLLEQDFRWIGNIPLNDVLTVVVEREPSQLSASSLEQMLKHGQAGRLAGLMLEKNMIFPAFHELLAHSSWPVRLGAMVVMEELAARQRDLAALVIDPLWRRFESVDDTVKGDLLYVLGAVGDSAMQPKLNRVLEGTYSQEVKDAAREALDKIAERKPPGFR